MKSIQFIAYLAWRNVVRYRKRTLQSFLILFFGTFCIMLVDSYMKGYSASSIERVVSQSGHLDVHASGYLDSAEAMPLDQAQLMADALTAAGVPVQLDEIPGTAHAIAYANSTVPGSQQTVTQASIAFVSKWIGQPRA